MKKGGGPNHGEELIYKLSSNKEFVQDLIKLRSDFGIPQAGFNNFEEEVKFVSAQDLAPFYERVDSLRKQHGISFGHDMYIREYVINGNIEAVKKHLESEVAFIEAPTLHDDFFEHDYEAMFLKDKEPYVKIFVFPNGTKTQVLNYIDKNWNSVEAIFKQQGVTRQKRVRKVNFKQRNTLIKNLAKKTKDELRILADEKDPAGIPHNTKYKYILIQIILKPEFGDVDDGYIRKFFSKK